MPKLKAIKADITTLAVDAIVNPTNPATRRAGGLCGVIWAAAGWTESHMSDLGLQTGEVFVTRAGFLPCKWVLHAVGPNYNLYNREIAEELLELTYANILQVAPDLGAKSIAIPAISTGIYGFPNDAAADIAVKTCLNSDLDLTLVAFDDETLKLYQELI